MSDITSKLTFLIKTFNRSACLQNCISSIRTLSKNVPVIVSDDSDEIIKQRNRKIINSYTSIKYLDLPFNTGLSFGRNEMVKQVNTELCFLLDDDNYITTLDKIIKAVKFLEEYQQYDIVAAVCKQRGLLYNRQSIAYSGVFEEVGSNYIKIKPNHVKIDNPYLDNLYETNLSLNLFLSRTDLLNQITWDDSLKLGEHEDFFIKLYKNNKHITICYDMVVGEIMDERRKYPNNILIHRTYTKKYNIRGEWTYF